MYICMCVCVCVYIYIYIYAKIAVDLIGGATVINGGNTAREHRLLHQKFSKISASALVHFPYDATKQSTFLHEHRLLEPLGREGQIGHDTEAAKRLS
jgi:hypothetical protein